MPCTRGFCTRDRTSTHRVATQRYDVVGSAGAQLHWFGLHSCRPQFLVKFRVPTYHAAVRVIRGYLALSRRSKPGEVIPIGYDRQHSEDQGVQIVRGDQQAVFLVVNDRADRANIRRNHHPARSHGLKKRYGQSFITGGQNEGVQGCIKLRHRVATSQENYLVIDFKRTRQLNVLVQLRTIAGDEKTRGWRQRTNTWNGAQQQI